MQGNDDSFEIDPTQQRAQILWRHATLADALAKMCCDPATQFKLKGYFLSCLSRMGLLSVRKAQVLPTGTVLTVASDYGEMDIHVDELDRDVQGNLLPPS